MGRSRPIVVLALAWTLLRFASVTLAAECKFFTGEKTDADWSYSAKSNDAVWLAAQHKTPTLFLKKSTLLPGTLVLETDARQLNIACGDADVITIPILRRGNTALTFEQSDDRPALKINDQEMPALRGPWIRIAQDKSDKMVFELVGATFATIHFPTPSIDIPLATSQPAALIIPVPVASRDANPQLLAQLGPARDMLHRVEPAIFRIDTFDASGQAFAHGTGFMVSPDGWAATNFHVVQGASSAKAVFATDANATPIPLELYSVHPEFDLALLKLGTTSVRYTPLSIARSEPAAGDDCWAIGFPKGLGYTVNKGSVNGVRDFSKLPAEYHAVFESYSSSSRWVQTDCTINHGNSGGPLINSNGEVIGINTWYWPEGNNMYFALSSTNVRQLLADVPATPITFAVAAKKYQSPAEQNEITGDLPKLNVASNISAVRLTATATAVPNAIGHRCNECSGTGRISTKVQTGTQSGNGMTAPVFSTRTDRCSKCGGTGIERSSDEIIERLADNLVRQIASLDRKDKDYQRALNAAYKCLTEAVIGDSRTWIKLNSDARGVVAQQKLLPRTAIVVRGDFVNSVADPDGNGQMFYATVSGTNQLVLLRYPVTAEDPKPGASVLMGGLIAGTAETRDKHRIVIVQNGFLVAPVISPDWYWWWTGESRRSIPIR